MEKKPLASPQQGVCEKLFNAFHIPSTFPTIRRLTFRPQETTNGSPAAAAAGAPPQTAQDPSHPKQHVQKEKATLISVQSMRPEEKAPKRPAVAPPQPQLPSVKEKEKAAAAAAVAAVPAPVPAPPATTASANQTGHHGKHRKNINEKVDEYIKITRNKLKNTGSHLGRTTTTKAKE